MTDKPEVKKSEANAKVEDAPKAAPKKKSKAKRRSVVEGNAHIRASYNNTIITISERNGDVIAQSSAGASGFKGARKATPYAAQIAAENATTKASSCFCKRSWKRTRTSNERNFIKSNRNLINN